MPKQRQHTAKTTTTMHFFFCAARLLRCGGVCCLGKLPLERQLFALFLCFVFIEGLDYRSPREAAIRPASPLPRSGRGRSKVSECVGCGSRTQKKRSLASADRPPLQLDRHTASPLSPRPRCLLSQHKSPNPPVSDSRGALRTTLTTSTKLQTT